jgi:two-component system chemotaxis response regulator CheY
MAVNILLVDDSPTVRALITKTLRLTHIEIGELYEAGNGQEALNAMKEHWVDLVLTDINMPVMGGVELIEKMSADPVLNAIPVIVVSTEGSQQRIDELKSKGVDAYVRKPFTPEMIQQTVHDVLGVTDGNQQ